ncbi:MAG: S41 family peptidase [Gemmatimonadota bacterium]
MRDVAIRLLRFAPATLFSLSGCAITRPAAGLPVTPPGAVTTAFARDAIAADLDSVLSMIERIHPDPYSVVSRDSVRHLRNALIADVPDSVKRAAVWPSYARVVSALGDGHTNIWPPREEVDQHAAAGGLVFPAAVTVSALGELTVSGYWRSDSLVHRGDVIVGINGRTSDSLLRVMRGEISGESTEWRTRMAADQFGTLLWYNGITPPYVVGLRRAGSTEVRTVNVEGVEPDSIRVRVRRGTVRAPTDVASPNFTYRLLDDRTAYFDLFSLSGTIERFRADLESALSRAIADSARTLVIDLRRNGGGDSRLGDELLSHVTTAPYRFAAAKIWKMSAEYRGYLKSRLRPPFDRIGIERIHPMGRKLFSGPDGTMVTLPEPPESHEARAPRFDGPVCVLIGPATFSSAVDLADGIKTYHLATLIGEETGGRPNGFGEVYYFRSPQTGFLVSVSSARFVRANGDMSDNRGVLPDIEVRRTAADVGAGRDPVLDRARTCPSLSR